MKRIRGKTRILDIFLWCLDNRHLNMFKQMFLVYNCNKCHGEMYKNVASKTTLEVEIGFLVNNTPEKENLGCFI